MSLIEFSKANDLRALRKRKHVGEEVFNLGDACRFAGDHRRREAGLYAGFEPEPNGKGKRLEREELKVIWQVAERLQQVR